VFAGPVEATAIGNILVQAIATGQIKSLSDARTIVRNSFDVAIFKPFSKAEWDEAYYRYENIKRKY
jgi:rhamnulokinase